MDQGKINELEEYAEAEINKLRMLYKSSIRQRLEFKEKMKWIVLRWKNQKLSQGFV